MTTHIIYYLNSSDFKDLLEKLFYISGIIVAVAALCGLRQLTLFKKDIVLRNTRAARERAIECAERYANYCKLDIINVVELQKAGLKTYKGPIGDFTRASLSEDLLPDSNKRFSLKSNMERLNLLEIVAATFVSGVADEEIGFQIFGSSFCHAVEYDYDIFSLWREDATDTSWFNIIELYQVWSPRISRSKLDQQRREIEMQIQSFPDRTIPSIGTD